MVDVASATPGPGGVALGGSNKGMNGITGRNWRDFGFGNKDLLGTHIGSPHEPRGKCWINESNRFLRCTQRRAFKASAVAWLGPATYPQDERQLRAAFD